MTSSSTALPPVWPIKSRQKPNFALAYQPVIDITRGRAAVVAFESLLRISSRNGMIGPVEVIANAEADGSIVSIDKWVLNEVLALARSRPALHVWINASQLSIADPDFLGEAVRALIATETLGRVSFEITETAHVEAGLLASRLRKLKRRAITVLIDDIRDGFAKEALLLNEAVSGCKLSRDSMLELHSSARARSEVAELLGICRERQKNVVLEGIETEEDLALAKELGIRWCQGYYFARPAMAEELSRFPQMRPVPIC